MGAMTLTRAMQQYGPYLHDRGSWVHPWLALIFVVLVGTAIGLGVWLLVRSSQHQAYPAQPFGPVGAPADPALDVLRMRFAKGEIDADEYTTRVAHLRGAPPPGPNPPGPNPA
jgi:putative membrane protein